MLEQAFQQPPVWAHLFHPDTDIFFPISNVFVINHPLQFHQIGDFPSPLQGQEVAHSWDYSSSAFESFSIFLLILLGLSSFCAAQQPLLIPRTAQHMFPWVLLSLYHLHPANIIPFPRSPLPGSVTDPLFISRAQSCEPCHRFNSQCCEPDVLLRRKNWGFESSGEDLIRALC